MHHYYKGDYMEVEAVVEDAMKAVEVLSESLEESATAISEEADALLEAVVEGESAAAAYADPLVATESAAASEETLLALESLAEITDSMIYMMGGSFILGSLFTILILVLLDFMRRNKTDKG
jgi:hypothetical protein